MTLREALTAAAAQLAADEHLHATATRDAELLLLHTLQIPAHHPRRPSRDRDSRPPNTPLYENTIARRLRHEPIQYITGQQEFYGLTLQVTPAVLIPRPETEHLVEAVLKLLPADQPLKIADIGTGSGAIAIALAAHLPQAAITALDISTEALDSRRSQRPRPTTSPTASASSNPTSYPLSLTKAKPSTPSSATRPTSPNSDRDTLHPQVRDHEPPTALFAGETGLDIYRRLIPQAHNALKPNGLLALEIGHGQQRSPHRPPRRWQNISFINDLQQIPRVALARRPDDAKID